MKRITKIEETKDFGYKKKLRVAAYARVSTDSEEQLLSLETQKAHYESYINANDEWIFAGIYFDEGVSGTKVEKRNGLLQMLSDCETRSIDFIITKSISRFSRNTTECLKMVRKLQELNIPVYFEKENINTGSMDSELMLTILSSMAESESISISENSKWSIQKRYENGTFIVSYPPYGYENRNGEMLIIPEQAVVVKRIFEEALTGKGTRAIARGLTQDGIPTKKGTKWSPGTVNGMLKNEKYTGDAIFQKTFTDRNFNRHLNNGELDQYLVQNHHEPIVTHEMFDKVQSLLEHHGKEKGIEKDKGKYQVRYAFSGKIICGECGSTFKRRQHYKPSGDYVAWCCSKHIDNKKGCSMKYITDEAIKVAFVRMMQKLESTQTKVIKPFTLSLSGKNDKKHLLKLSEIDECIEKNIEQRQVLVSLMSSAILEPAVFNKENNALNAELNNLQAEKEALSGSITFNRKQSEEAQKLLKYLSKCGAISHYDDEIFLEYVEKIVVHSRGEIIFSLKCGLNLSERLVK
ncbi:recombinase family protein [Clostridium folliculivorans]|uniref:recombinase family protein n=1 Tax=Clostridium folliculivorans TaxID=2886038 RepID=UPI0021C34408|nr:recombinase family protein [Clostridium folliculivorans]GKU31438.1 resolvase [Clostridium folliculivorans]